MKKMVIALPLLLWWNSACASPVNGTFQATRECDAYTSFAKGRNPGLIKVKPGVIYQAAEVNKKDGWNWVRVFVSDADDNLRWVAKDCGTTDFRVTDASPSSPHGGKKSSQNDSCSTANQYDGYVLAMTWQPGFCEHFKYSGSKPECDALNSGNLSISNLTLHGLWPNKKKCGSNYGKCSDKPMELSENTISEMGPWMPNFFYSTSFGASEWKKHGTCQEREDDAYFLLAKDILQRVDKSEIGAYIKANIGEEINTDEYRRRIEEALGKEVADRMQIICADKKYFQEVRLNLPKKLATVDNIQKMVSGAEKFTHFTSGCSKEVYIEKPGDD